MSLICSSLPFVSTAKNVTKSIRFAIEWDIPNFSTHKDETTRLFSPCVTSEELGLVSGYGQWHLTLIPLDEIKKEKFVSLYLQRTAITVDPFIVEFTIRIRSSCSVGYQMRICEDSLLAAGTRPKISIMKNAQGLGWKGFITHNKLFDPLNGYLNDDILSVHTDIAITLPSKPQSVPSPTAVAVQHHCLNLAGLLDSATYSDFTLISADGTTFPVHRCILSAASPEIASLVATDGATEWIIPHVNDVVMLQLLHFIYRGGISPTMDRLGVEDLLDAANMYGLGKLKDLCVEQLVTAGITRDNAYRLLDASGKYALPILKDASVGYLKGQIKMANVGEILIAGKTRNVADLVKAALDFLRDGRVQAFIETGDFDKVQLYSHELAREVFRCAWNPIE